MSRVSLTTCKTHAPTIVDAESGLLGRRSFTVATLTAFGLHEYHRWESLQNTKRGRP